MRRKKENETDLPCTPFADYYEYREKLITACIEWHKKNPQYKGVADNIEKLLENLPNELGKEA